MARAVRRTDPLEEPPCETFERGIDLGLAVEDMRGVDACDVDTEIGEQPWVGIAGGEVHHALGDWRVHLGHADVSGNEGAVPTPTLHHTPRRQCPIGGGDGVRCQTGCFRQLTDRRQSHAGGEEASRHRPFDVIDDIGCRGGRDWDRLI